MYKYLVSALFVLLIILVVYPSSTSDVSGAAYGDNSNEGADGYLDSSGESNVDHSGTAAQNVIDAAGPENDPSAASTGEGSNYVPPITTSSSNTSSSDQDEPIEKEDIVTADDFTEEDEEKDSKETIQVITNTVADINTDNKETEQNIRRTVRDTVQNATADVDTDVAQTIDKETDSFVDSIRDQFLDRSLATDKTTEQIERDVDISISDFERNVEEKTGIKIDLRTDRNNIREAIVKHKEAVEEKKRVITSRGGDLLFTDSDNDGLSDYDEINIYKTDPNSAKTVDGDLTDGEKVLRGINPTSKEDKIVHSDPREDTTAVISDSYNVRNISVVKEAVVELSGEDDKKIVEKEQLVLEGTAIPNSVVTLYIYSTPIIVTVKADEDGLWSYTLDQELESGEHEVYVATVDNAGKIVARSNPIPFVKTAEAAVLGSDLPPLNFDQGPLFDRSFFAAVALIIFGFVVMALMFIGNSKGNKEMKV